MGSDKSNLVWIDQQPLLLHTFHAMEQAGWTAHAVLSPKNYPCWKSVIPSNRAILNSFPQLGKTTSIACGVAAISATADWILITSVDQPRLPQLYCQLLECAKSTDASVILPFSNGHRSHPVVVRGCFRLQLLELHEHAFGLRGFLDAHSNETHRFPVDDPRQLGWDLNTPDDYQAALAYFGGSAGLRED